MLDKKTYGEGMALDLGFRIDSESLKVGLSPGGKTLLLIPLPPFDYRLFSLKSSLLKVSSSE